MTRERDRIQENANKYIVKNCPAFNPQAYEHCCSLDGNYKCEGCTDCVIKQVIEKCKEELGECKDCGCSEPHWVCIGEKAMGKAILNMFDIEEINK